MYGIFHLDYVLYYFWIKKFHRNLIEKFTIEGMTDEEFLSKDFDFFVNSN